MWRPCVVVSTPPPSGMVIDTPPPSGMIVATPLPSDIPSSPTSPKCISPEAIDEKLVHYVKLFGTRWPLIRCHMQAQFCCSFPARYLERRWDALQQQQEAAARMTVSQDARRSPGEKSLRSPLAAMDDINDTAGNINPGIQERLPIQGLPKPKRWREDSGSSPMQPVRPPPPASPRTPTNALFARRCPTFLLSPDSSLAAPDGVRRQLKAVYLAALLANGGPSPPGGTATTATDATCDAAGRGTEAPSPFASEDEKHQVAALIARELSGFRRRPSDRRGKEATGVLGGTSHGHATSEAAPLNGAAAASQSAATKSSNLKPTAHSSTAHSSPSLLTAHRSGAEGGSGGQAAGASKRASPWRWPKPSAASLRA